MLSFFCIFEIQHNSWCAGCLVQFVVNCFHFSVSLRYNTTWSICRNWQNRLWIAFIFLYLWDTTQPYHKFDFRLHRCELLSFFCIFEIQHNVIFSFPILRIVVNCFHFSVSLRYNTTYTWIWPHVIRLWIAFIFLYLWDTTQQWCIWAYIKNSCELLSFFCIFEIQHNSSFTLSMISTVVNCFHFSVSLRYNTTKHFMMASWISLWIAFIFLYLWDTTQLQQPSWLLWICCELLSFFCIFEIQHNWWKFYALLLVVVNCFHFSVSLRYNTTLV